MSAPISTRQQQRATWSKGVSEREPFSVRGEQDPYPDGLKADLTAVRPINLCDSILGLYIWPTVQQKGKIKRGKQRTPPGGMRRVWGCGGGRCVRDGRHEVCWGFAEAASPGLKKWPQSAAPGAQPPVELPPGLAGGCLPYCEAAKFQVPALSIPSRSPNGSSSSR